MELAAFLLTTLVECGTASGAHEDGGLSHGKKGLRIIVFSMRTEADDDSCLRYRKRSR